MTDATGTGKPAQKVVHYQSISYSDEEEEQSDNHVGATSLGKVEANPEGLYTNLRKLDDLCGQVNSPDKTTDEDVHLENTEGVVTGSLIAGTDADNEGLGIDEGLLAGDHEDYGAEEGVDSVMVEVAVYMCKLCGGTFKHQNDMESHLLSEHDLGEQTALFRVLKHVKRKKKMYRKEKDGYVHCQYCHHRSRRSINVREHEKEKHANEDIPQKLYECKLCSNRFAIQDIFSHIQTEHESEADSLNFIGNSLTEHYTVSFSTEAKTVLAEENSAMDGDQETIEMSDDGFYHCDKCEFISKELSDVTEHYKEHSLAKSSSSGGRYNHCSQCPYKSKSVRGLKLHERMKHPAMKNKLDDMTCSTCGQKRQKNVVHICKMSNNGKRRQLLRNAEGHFVCKDCPFTAKQYQSMYIHTKANRHQAERIASARPVKKKLISEETEDEDMMQDTVRVLRQRTPKKNGNPDLPEESISETNDFDSAQVVPIHTDDITEAAVEGQTIAQDTDKTETYIEGEWPAGVEGLIDSDTPDSGLDDSDLDPEWAPAATPSQPKIKRGPGRPRKDAGSGSDSDSDNEASSRKRRASSDGGGHTDKRRKYMEVPKDPNSEPPKKLPSGTFQCNFCEFESKYHQSTEVHQWRHTGYKPYKCEVCPAAFRSRAQLDRHPCVAVLGDKDDTIDKPAKPTTDTDGPTSMPELDQTPPNKANSDTDDVPAAAENTEPVNDKEVQIPPTDNAQVENNQSSNPGSSEKNMLEVLQENPDPVVTSPTPIVIAPPLGSHIGNPQVADSEDNHNLSVPNLDGNGDNPDLGSPQGVQNTLIGPRMTSPVGIPLNIAPISSMGGVDPPRQIPMPMGGMGGFPDGSQYGMGNPPPIMDMPMGPSNDMIHNMPGMMGVGGPSMHSEGVMHPGHYPPGYQQVNAGPAQHQMNPMHPHMGGVMTPAEPPFPAPSMGLMDHLNLMPTNNMMGSAGGYAGPPNPQLPPQRHPSMEQIGPNMMPMDNTNFMIDLNTSESQERFDMNQPLSNPNLDMNMQVVSTGNRTPEGNVLAPPTTSTNSQRLPSSVSPLQQTAMSEPTTPTTVQATPEQTVFSIASSPLSLINQVSDSESMASMSVLPTSNVLPSDRDADTGSTSDRSEAAASTADNSATLQGNDLDRSDAPSSTAETPPVSNTETSWSLSAGSGTDTITDTTSNMTVSSAGGTLEPSASDITAAALMAISATAPASASTQPVTSTQPTASTSASSMSGLVVTAVTGTTPTALTQPSTAPKPATNDTGKTINDLFKCILCRVYFEDQQMHRNHMVHHGQVVGTCRICSKMFRTPLLFMNHLHCSANCQGPHANTTVPQFAATTTRGRGRGTRGGITPSVTTQRLPQGYPQIQQGSVRGGRGRATPQPMTMPMSPIGQTRMASPRGSPLQAMRQMSPTAGRRGRPPLGVNRPTTAYNAALMRQPLQQQQRQFSAHLQQLGAMRPATATVRQPPPRRRQQQTISDDVIVID